MDYKIIMRLKDIQQELHEAKKWSEVERADQMLTKLIEEID